MSAASAAQPVPRLLLLLLLLAIAALSLFSLPLMVSPYELNADASWLLEVCERVLAGQKLYVDVLETNPPMSVWLYLPSVWFAQQIGLRPEIAVYTFTLLFCLASIALTVSIIRKAGWLEGTALWVVAAGLVYVFVFLPGGNFTQREHFAAVALLPFLTVLAARAHFGLKPSLLLVLTIGIGAGLCAAIKPHFIAAILLPVFGITVQRRSIWPLFHPENLIAAAVFGLYVLCFWLFASAYFTTVWPLVSASYLGDRYPLQILIIWLVNSGLMLLALSAGVLFRTNGSGTVVFWLATAGFTFAYFVQGKGWPYHIYPAAAFCVVAILLSVARGANRLHSTYLRAVPKAVMICCVLVFAGLMRNAPITGPLAAEITRIKANPSIMVVSGNLSFHFPMVRSINGEWVSRLCSNWIATTALNVVAKQETSEPEKAVLNAAIGTERRFLREDVEKGKPDIIVFMLQPFSWLDWAREDAAFATLLKRYRPVSWQGSAVFAIYERVLP